MVKMSSFPYTLCLPSASPNKPKSSWPRIIPIYIKSLEQQTESRTPDTKPLNRP